MIGAIVSFFVYVYPGKLMKQYFLLIDWLMSSFHAAKVHSFIINQIKFEILRPVT